VVGAVSHPALREALAEQGILVRCGREIAREDQGLETERVAGHSDMIDKGTQKGSPGNGCGTEELTKSSSERSFVLATRIGRGLFS
jgi:hypothetical protein